MFGLTSQVPDYAILIVSGVVGVQRMTREHFALAMALKLPTFIVVTKVDLCSPKQRDLVVATLKSIIKVSIARSGASHVTMGAERLTGACVTPLPWLARTVAWCGA